MNEFANLESFNQALARSCKVSGNQLSITNEELFRKETIDQLIWNAVFASNEQVKAYARWIIWEASQALGCPASSIHSFYMARANNAWKDMTTPAINIRTLTYDFSRTIFRTLKKFDAANCLMEIAKSEVSYTDQRPEEYASCVLAAAIKENFQGPVFIQGDHFQASEKNYKADPKKEIESLKKLITEGVAAGFYNIDVDSSTLVDLSKSSIIEQQRANFEVCAELTKHIRKVEPKGITVSVGGEIGEVGKKNSTPEELIAFMEGYNGILSLCGNCVGISKISIQTGTEHGGAVLPDGSIAKVKLDLDTLEDLGQIAREQFKIGGAVQHGASTLPESAFDNFAKRQAVEVHLATAFQNTLYDSKAFPADLKKKIYAWLEKNCADERKSDWTEEQFYYKTRKKGFAAFKKEIWSLPESTKNALMNELAESFDVMFEGLGIQGSRKALLQHVPLVSVHKPNPVA